MMGMYMVSETWEHKSVPVRYSVQRFGVIWSKAKRQTGSETGLNVIAARDWTVIDILNFFERYEAHKHVHLVLVTLMF